MPSRKLIMRRRERRPGQPTSLQKQGSVVRNRAGPIWAKVYPTAGDRPKNRSRADLKIAQFTPSGREGGKRVVTWGLRRAAGGPWPDLATTRSPTPFGAVPWARRGFTAEFGMGSGGARALWSPGRARGPAAPEGPQRSEISSDGTGVTTPMFGRGRAAGCLRAALGSGLTPPPRHGWRDGRVPWSWSREALGHGRQRSDVGGQMSAHPAMGPALLCHLTSVL